MPVIAGSYAFLSKKDKEEGRTRDLVPVLIQARQTFETDEYRFEMTDQFGNVSYLFVNASDLIKLVGDIPARKSAPEGEILGDRAYHLMCKMIEKLR